MAFAFVSVCFQVSSFQARHDAVRIRKGLCLQWQQQPGSAMAGQGQHRPAEVTVRELSADTEQQQPAITSSYHLIRRYLEHAAASTSSSLATNPSWLSWKAFAFYLSSEGMRQGSCG